MARSEAASVRELAGATSAEIGARRAAEEQLGELRGRVAALSRQADDALRRAASTVSTAVDVVR